VLGVDLNDAHLATGVLDAAGNPVGEPCSVEVITAGLAASQRDGRVRAAITALLDHAQQRNCSAIVVENLDFADTRATGRETLGRGKRGKWLRGTVDDGRHTGCGRVSVMVAQWAHPSRGAGQGAR
jgi:hypothetical protein